MKYDWTTAEAFGRGSASLLASSALFVAFSYLCVTALPVAHSTGMAIGIMAGFPLWVGAGCYAVLARTSVRAWVVLAGATLLLSAWAFLSIHFL
ncbi:hypothetical protein CRI94_16135 [Longibacter salinarum]|uniref:DUF3649 domain-containing protein n=1 Tax=Longibacter salinarum TaxID=1850348 RepID=A0A2A8CU03_9BACT|nr:hypothetical protein [Longibacter salinarum]PEN11315.1 hypothetical protein CRI94_16135 [Longibacter salinarum]